MSTTRNSGFTMLELLVTLAIAALVVTIGVPSFQGVLDNQRLTAASNELVTSFNFARSEAIKRVAYVSVCKSSDGFTCTPAAAWNAGWIVFANAGVATPGTVDAGDEVIRVSPALEDTLSISPSGTIGNFVTFRPSGTAGTNVANMTGTLTVCDERGADEARGIVLQSSGHWSVSHTSDHGGAPLACP